MSNDADEVCVYSDVLSSSDVTMLVAGAAMDSVGTPVFYRDIRRAPKSEQDTPTGNEVLDGESDDSS